MAEAPRPLAFAELVDAAGPGVVAVEGASEQVVRCAEPLWLAGPDALSFSSATGDTAIRAVAASRAGVVVCRPEAAKAASAAVIVSDDPRLTFMRILNALFRTTPPIGIHPTATIADGAEVDQRAYVGPYCYVDRAYIGAGTILSGHVNVHAGVRIGRNVTVGAGAMIGVNGLGVHRNEEGVLERFPQLGGVEIQDDVDIGAGTTVQRGTLGDTVIQAGAKLDCFILVAHNVTIGRDTAVTPHVMIGGSARLGDRVWIGPCAAIRDGGIEVGDDAVVGMGAVVTKDVAAGETVMGVPARPVAEARATLQALRGLVEGEQAPRDVDP